MNETTSLTCQTQCPTACPCPILLSIASSIAHEEDALACILNAECASYDAACKRFLSENTMSVIGCVADNGHKFYVCGSIKR